MLVTAEYVRVDKRKARELYDAGKTIVMSLDKPYCAIGDTVHFTGVTTVTKEAAGDTFDKLAADGLMWKHRYSGSQGLVWYTPKEQPAPRCDHERTLGDLSGMVESGTESKCPKCGEMVTYW